MNKTIHLFLLLSLILSSCKSDDNGSTDVCILYSVLVSDNCDCTEILCGSIHFVSEEEFNRLNTILNTNSDTCIMVNGTDTLDADFSGFLIWTNQDPCPTPFG